MDLPDLKFSYISPSVQRLRGWTAEEIMRQPLSASLTQESGERVSRALEMALAQVAAGNREAQIHVMEVDQPHKDGHNVPTEVVTTILLDISGRPQQVLGITRDISERRRTEALSIAKEAAEAANRAKSTFLATMSHELRTPMNAIMGMTELALLRATDERQKNQLQKALTGAQNLLAVINDVLDISRIEAERLQLKSLPFTLSEVLANLNNLVGHLAEARGLSFSIDLPPALATTPLQGDPYRLGQILLNLCGNGVKFTQHGHVALRIEEAPAAEGHCQLRCEIEDTGIGIPPEVQKKLFRAFEQADGSSTRRHGGTGLGLAISKRLVEMMDGQIGVRSVPGSCSTFWFTVTLARRREQPVPDARPHALAGSGEARLRREHGGMRILLVEDDALNREVSRDLLLAAGLDVDTAEDGREAVSRMLANDYALVLMDLQMPRLNGLEACAEIRAAGYTELPIIAMTANVFAEDRQRCKEAGMNDHIAKPVDPERLYDTLMQWLAKPRG